MAKIVYFLIKFFCFQVQDITVFSIFDYFTCTIEKIVQQAIINES